MWLFLPFGFFSVVEHRDDSSSLLVRARVRADLAALLRRVGSKTRIERTPSADYPYRAVLPRGTVAQVMSDFVNAELDYDNFKNAVAAEQGLHRARAYHDVWQVVRGIEDQEARAPASPPAPRLRRAW